MRNRFLRIFLFYSHPCGVLFCSRIRLLKIGLQEQIYFLGKESSFKNFDLKGVKIKFSTWTKIKQSIKRFRVSENSFYGLFSPQRPSAGVGVNPYLKFNLPIVLRVRGSSEAATAIPIREIIVTSELIIIAADQARKFYQLEKNISKFSHLIWFYSSDLKFRIDIFQI